MILEEAALLRPFVRETVFESGAIYSDLQIGCRSDQAGLLPEREPRHVQRVALRCRYRDSWEQPGLMAPGEVVEITIDPMPTSNLFRRGHRIRLDISSSNFPRFDVNPNTGAPEGSAGPRVVAFNTVHMGPGRASRVVLPMQPVAPTEAVSEATKDPAAR